MCKCDQQHRVKTHAMQRLRQQVQLGTWKGLIHHQWVVCASPKGRKGRKCISAQASLGAMNVAAMRATDRQMVHFTAHNFSVFETHEVNLRSAASNIDFKDLIFLSFSETHSKFLKNEKPSVCNG